MVGNKCPLRRLNWAESYDYFFGINQDIYARDGVTATASPFVPRALFEAVGGFDAQLIWGATSPSPAAPRAQRRLVRPAGHVGPVAGAAAHPHAEIQARHLRAVSFSWPGVAYCPPVRPARERFPSTSLPQGWELCPEVGDGRHQAAA